MAHFNHFDFLAPFYDRFIKPTDFTRFSRFVGLPVEGRLLDAGGGTGGKSYPLLKMVTSIVIVDSSMGMLTQASNKVGLMTVGSEVERLPFEDESFERVIMVDAFHHVSDYRVTAGELWRVVKPGGRIVIEEPDIRTAPIKIMAIIEKLALMRSHFISPADIVATFAYPNTAVRIEIEDSTAWIVIDKQAIL
jgi:demethylmenaquinone methyltransferase/2-methoxy-6-polyprenyl-1,4-benzoquinol methylase